MLSAVKGNSKWRLTCYPSFMYFIYANQMLSSCCIVIWECSKKLKLHVNMAQNFFFVSLHLLNSWLKAKLVTLHRHICCLPWFVRGQLVATQMKSIMLCIWPVLNILLHHIFLSCHKLLLTTHEIWETVSLLKWSNKPFFYVYSFCTFL